MATGRSYERKFCHGNKGLAMASVLKRKLRLSMVPKFRFYRPEPVNSTSIHFERSLISWKFISRNIVSTQEGDQSAQMNKQHKMTWHKSVLFLRSFEMTDTHPSCHGSGQRIRVEVALFTVILWPLSYVGRDFQADLRLREGTTFAVYLLIRLLPFAQTSPGKTQNHHRSPILITRCPLFTSLA